VAVSKDNILEAISGMTVMEIVDLISDMEEKFGVTAAAAVAAAPAGAAGGAEAEEEQTEFNVVMTSFGAKKIAVIKVVRVITGLGLKQAKGMVESVPVTVKEALSKDDAADILKKLKDAGASVELK